MVKRIDGIYAQIKTTIAKPEVKRGFKIGTILAIVLGLIGALLVNLSVTTRKARALDVANGDGILFYAETANTTPQWRTYTNSTNDFSANSGTVAGAQPAINQIKTSPTKQEAIAGYQDTSGNLRVLCYDGTSWSEDWTIAVAGAGTPTTRRFDIAYETNTGDVTVAYSRNTAAANALAYRYKLGSAGCGSANWAAAANFPTTTTVTSATVMWVRAARDGRSAQNLSAWVWLDNAATQADLGAAIWSGSVFTNFKSLETSMEHITAVGDTDNFDVQYESLSGDVMVVWGNSAGGSGTNGYRYNTCTGGTSSCTWLGSAATMPTTADGAMMVDLSPDPLSDKMAMAGICAASDDMSAGYWDGTGPWIGYANLDTSTETTAQLPGMKLMTTGWLTNNGNTKWYISYDDSTGNGLSWYIQAPGTAPGPTTKQSDFISTPAIDDLRGRYDTDVNPFNTAELIQTLSDVNNQIVAFKLTMDTAGTATWSNMASAVSLGTKPSHPQQGFSFNYWRYIPVATITISGSCYQYDQISACTDAGAEVIAVAVNGVLQAQTDGTVDISWEITGITQPSANATITVFINGEATVNERATAATKYNSGGTGNIGGVVLYQRHLTIGSDQNTTVTNADMDDYDYNAGADPDDADIIYDVDASFNLTVDNLGSYTDERLRILASNTYQPDSVTGRTNTTTDMQIVGTLTANANTFNIYGSWTTSGTFTAGTSAVDFKAGSGTQDLTSGGIGAGKLFNDLTHSGAGTLRLVTNAIDVDGAFSQTAGTFNCNGQNQNFSGAFSLSLGTVYTKGGTLTFDGGSQTVTDSTAAPGQDLGAVTIGPSTTTSVSTANKMHVTTLTTGADDTLDISSDTLTIRGTGTPFTEGGAFTITSSTVIYAGAGATNISTTQYNNLTLTPESGLATYTLLGSLTAGNALTGNLTISANATLDNDLTNKYSITLPGNWTNSGAFTSNAGGTVTLSGAGGSTQVVGGSSNTTFYNLYATAATARTINFASLSTTTVSNLWTATGSAGQNLSLGRNGGSGSEQWNVNPNTWTVDYVTPSNSNNQAASPINPANYTDGGNNTNWFVTNLPPDTPTNLGPAGYIDAAGWMNDNTPTVNFDITDPDPAEQVKYRIQIDDTAGFGSVVLDYQPSSFGAEGTYNYTVGQAGSYAVGSPGMTLSDSAAGGGYYWRVKGIDDDLAESAYEEAGVDGTIDFRVDATAPTGGTVNDGTSGDQDWNDGSLTQISGNWSGFDATTSGLNKYEYAIRRKPDDNYWSVCAGAGAWQAGANWCNNGVSTSFTQNNLNLQTGVIYYISVRAVDNAANTGSPVNSNGQQVEPTLSFVLTGTTITFADLNNGNGWTDTKTGDVTTSTNASAGYTVSAYLTDYLRSLGYPTITIGDFQGTYALPETWEAGEYGFGYTTNDTDVNLGKFVGSKYAAFNSSHTAPGDVLADHQDAVNGSTGAVVDEVFTITYKVAVSQTQTASTYRTYAVYIVTANY